MPVTIYATIEELRGSIGAVGSAEDERLNLALASASRMVDQICRRRFWVDDDDALTTRVYAPTSFGTLYVDDISTSVGLIVESDEGSDGTFETTWATTDYQLLPFNPESGWPYDALQAVGVYLFPSCPERRYGRTGSVRVTARHGWPTVPDPVKSATIIAATELWKTKDAPWGVAGVSGVDGFVIRVRQNPMVATLLAPYGLGPVLA